MLALPNLPHDIRSRFLSEDEKQLAKDRTTEENIQTQRTKLGWKSFRTLLFNWQPPLMAFLIFCQVFSYYPTGTPFTLWLKSRNELSVPQVNNIPTGGNALSLVSALAQAWYADTFNDRLSPYIFSSVCAGIGAAILVSHHVSENATYFAFFAMFASHGVAPNWQAWVGDVTASNSELRAYAIAAGNVASEVGSLVVPLIVFQVRQAPEFRAGFIFSLVSCVCEAIAAICVYYLSKKEGKIPLEEILVVELEKGASDE